MAASSPSPSGQQSVVWGSDRVEGNSSVRAAYARRPLACKRIRTITDHPGPPRAMWSGSCTTSFPKSGARARSDRKPSGDQQSPWQNPVHETYRSVNSTSWPRIPTPRRSRMGWQQPCNLPSLQVPVRAHARLKYRTLLPDAPFLAGFHPQ